MTARASRPGSQDLAARALAVVLDLEAGDLRADSPLADLGADSVARIQWADVVEELAAAEGTPVAVPRLAHLVRRSATSRRARPSHLLADLASPSRRHDPA